MHSFELRPNSSLTPRAAAWFYGSLVAVMLGVAGGCAALGFWPVLPFAGLEAAVLLGAVRWVQRRAAAREYIRVDEALVRVEKYGPRSGGRPSPAAYTFHRPWTRVELRRGRREHWPSQLLFRSRSESVEVGAFLTEGERRGLRDRLAEVLAGNDQPTGRI